MDEPIQKTLEEYLILALEDAISEEEAQRLNQILKGHPERIRYAIHFLQLASHIKQSKKLAAMSKAWLSIDPGDSFSGFLKLMAEYEKAAEAVEVDSRPSPPAAAVCKAAPVPAGRPRVSRLSLAALFLSSVALIFIFAYAYWGQISGGVETVTIYDSIRACWAEKNLQAELKNGARLSTKSAPLRLLEGTVKIRFDNGAVLVLEGPAEFLILAPDHVQLPSGSLYASIGPEAFGFTVSTKNAKVVDLGTEFGIQAHQSGDSEVHVVKGKTVVAASDGGKLNDSQIVLNGTARWIDARSRTIREAVFNPDKFVRNIDSRHNLLSRGKLTLDLADITAGGSGRGPAKLDVWLDPKSGYTPSSIHEHDTSEHYLPIPSNPYVDGLFVPGGQSSTQIISSEHDRFVDCPQTSGLFYANLGVNPAPSSLRINGRRDGLISFQDTIYGTAEHPCLVLHANLGITYDLRAVRNEYSEWKLDRFTARVGIADLKEPYPCNADFWVLVDGQVRYCLKNCREKGKLADVSVELRPTDRFLTLMTTDGGDPDVPRIYERAISCDWCVFAEPVLELR
ncbi:MAG TPA: NPCBM/NEW2 domain-containing protein [Anaerohalosphaeraceae bacterium]|nr:NPCBM/NEW2 domain-containing protein [Anaerohalosphaeraceae bacterium]HPB92918.1 NPCBM/NEW2 domain-containing protein [Anaerohalosphaeraceae bacterium]HRT23274.1 NPCBM/NEW2 domain-containing protein [Anaerohalosphaeraceae bacterium]